MMIKCLLKGLRFRIFRIYALYNNNSCVFTKQWRRHWFVCRCHITIMLLPRHWTYKRVAIKIKLVTQPFASHVHFCTRAHCVNNWTLKQLRLKFLQQSQSCQGSSYFSFIPIVFEIKLHSLWWQLRIHQVITNIWKRRK